VRSFLRPKRLLRETRQYDRLALQVGKGDVEHLHRSPEQFPGLFSLAQRHKLTQTSRCTFLLLLVQVLVERELPSNEMKREKIAELPCTQSNAPVRTLAMPRSMD
jgi:hypothetical protein